MAEAFRKALRKPDFADRTIDEVISQKFKNSELAEEGQDIGSVEREG